LQRVRGNSREFPVLSAQATIIITSWSVHTWLKALDIDCQIVVYDPSAGSLNVDILASLDDAKIDA